MDYSASMILHRLVFFQLHFFFLRFSLFFFVAVCDSTVTNNLVKKRDFTAAKLILFGNSTPYLTVLTLIEYKSVFRLVPLEKKKKDHNEKKKRREKDLIVSIFFFLKTVFNCSACDSRSALTVNKISTVRWCFVLFLLLGAARRPNQTSFFFF